MRHSQNNKNTKSTRSFGVEPLEGRRMFSITNMPILISGTGGYDNIELHYSTSNARYEWSVNGKNYAWATGFTPSYIEVDGGAGNDTINVTSTLPDAIVKVCGNSGADNITIGNQVSGATMGHVTVYGEDADGYNGPSNDKLTVSSWNLATPTSHLVDDIYSDHVNVGGYLKGSFQNLPTARIDFKAIKGLTVSGPAYDPASFNVHSVANGVPLRLIDGFKADTTSIGDGDLAKNIQDNITLNHVSYGDALYVLDSNGQQGTYFDINSNKISWLPSGGGQWITLPEQANVNVYGTAYDDGFRTEGMLDLQGLNLFGAKGNDEFDIGYDNLSLESTYPLYIYAGAGNDTVKFLDGQDTFDQIYALTPTTLTARGMTTANFSAAEHVEVGGGRGNNTFYVTPSATTEYRLYGHEIPPAGQVADLVMNLAGATNAHFFNGYNAGDGVYTFDNRQNVYITGFRSYTPPFSAAPAIVASHRVSPSAARTGAHTKLNSVLVD